MKQATLIDLGTREYAEVWALQKDLLTKRQTDEISDTLILVEHPDVLTVGRKIAAKENILRADMPIFEVERGGDVTYHGPGQLVGYPIVKLAEDERDLHVYLRNLEEALIATCAHFELHATRKAGFTGVWVGEPTALRKIASIGIAVRRWVTLHGFAFNVATDHARWSAINPCGLDANVMTSLSAETGRAISVEQVKPIAARKLGRVLGRTFVD